MTRPREIPQWAWYEAAVGADHHSKRQVHIARAVMRVRNEALEEAAKIAEGIGIPRVASGDRNLMVPVEIAQEIRRLKFPES